MSTANPSPNTAECKHCGTAYTNYHTPGFCSEDCYDAHQGQKLLNTLENDHCVCGNCGTVLKTIEKPKPERAFDKTGDGWTYDHDEERWRIQWYGQIISEQSAIGFQHKTTEADPEEMGTVCGNCGNMTLGKRFPETQDRFQLEYASSILDTIRKKREEGTHDKEIDGHAFFHALVDTREIPLALGRAIED